MNCAGSGRNSSFVPGGHSPVQGGLLHTPLKSGLPLAMRGAGAFRFGLPSRVLGTCAVGYFSHCATTFNGKSPSSAVIAIVVRIRLRLLNAESECRDRTRMD